jgi:hypothetical protein
VCIYATICTGLITLFAGMIIPDKVRGEYSENLLGGLTSHLIGPPLLLLGFHIFVVIVGVLILSGAVNTSIIGANGVMNRVAEDGVLLDWFRKPHNRFGTSYRIINLVALLQLTTILLSRGDTNKLGEAYAFGVVWSFFMNSLGVLVLRYHRKDQEYKVPLNFRIGGAELPVGLFLTTLTLFLVALANLFSKKTATIWGVAFTAFLYVLFTISERINSEKMLPERKGLEQFNLIHQPDVTGQTLRARPGCILVAVRDYNNMAHLYNVLNKTNLRRHDIVVMTVRQISTAAGEYDLEDAQLFSRYEEELFSHVVSLAEKQGKRVDLLVVPGIDPYYAMTQTAAKVKASRLVTGVSAKMDSEELACRIGLAWERLPVVERHSFSLEILRPGRPSVFVNLGPHPPRLWPEDLDRLHELWLRLTERGFGPKLHHRDVVGVALRRMERDLSSEWKAEVIEDLKREIAGRE